MAATTTNTLSTDLQFIEELVQKGGPQPHEYAVLDQWLINLDQKIQKGRYSEKELKVIRDAFGETLSIKTMQGRALQKPYGYAGDFEVIDKTYTYHIAEEPRLKKWDEYTQQRGFLRALRNRKTYFKQMLTEQLDKKPEGLEVLNIASGPCRDVAEFLEEYPDSNLHIDCLEFDPRAIRYAQQLLKGKHQVSFIHQNIFKFSTDKKYDLIWSAGLFDYFDDHTFQTILERTLSWLKPSGTVIVGNFTRDCPASVAHFNLVNWPLYYRDRGHLNRLAQAAGVPEATREVRAEPLGINLFLHCSSNA